MSWFFDLRQPVPLPRGLAMAACVALMFMLIGCGQEHQSGPLPPSGERAKVGVVTIVGRSVALTAELPGRVSASLVSEVRPQVAGIIRERIFREGSEVKAGDPLYQIDPASYQAAYDSAVAAEQKAEAAAPSAQAKVERYQSLAKSNAVSKQDLDDAVATLAQAKADIAAAKADVATANINLDFTTIRAPISGRADASSLTPAPSSPRARIPPSRRSARSIPSTSASSSRARTCCASASRSAPGG